jgi:hypothetical protein
MRVVLECLIVHNILIYFALFRLHQPCGPYLAASKLYENSTVYFHLLIYIVVQLLKLNYILNACWH